jgi:hypothetical protein
MVRVVAEGGFKVLIMVGVEALDTQQREQQETKMTAMLLVWVEIVKGLLILQVCF